MDYYNVFGAEIGSEISLPLCAQSNNSPEASLDILIRRSPARIDKIFGGHELSSPDGEVVAQIQKRGSDLVLEFIGLATFCLSEKTLWVDQLATDLSSLENTKALLLNQVLPMVLSLSSDLILHASSVTDGVNGWAFVGIEGTGKSTLSGGLYARGFRLLSDDASRLRVTEISTDVMAGVPEVRLFESAFSEIFPGKSLEETTAVFRKRRLQTGRLLQNTSSKEISLKKLFCLNPSTSTERVSITPIGDRQAFERILPCLFRFDLWDQTTRRREFEMLSQLVANVPAVEVNYPYDWKQLPKLLDLMDLEMRKS